LVVTNLAWSGTPQVKIDTYFSKQDKMMVINGRELQHAQLVSL
jgi:hypothetical protein